MPSSSRRCLWRFRAPVLTSDLRALSGSAVWIVGGRLPPAVLVEPTSTLLIRYGIVQPPSSTSVSGNVMAETEYLTPRTRPDNTCRMICLHRNHVPRGPPRPPPPQRPKIYSPRSTRIARPVLSRCRTGARQADDIAAKGSAQPAAPGHRPPTEGDWDMVYARAPSGEN